MATLVDTTIRLLSQEPLAARVSSSRLLEVAELLDRAGFAALEVSGGGCFDAAVRRGVDLQVEGRGELSVRGDREGLLRALRNLAANAIQWSPTGATVTVRLVGLDETIEVTIDDAGPGVPPELREEIFRPFVTTKGETRGTGLGLPISREIVVRHGGRVLVESRPGEGATFTVVLPLTPAFESKAAPSR